MEKLIKVHPRDNVQIVAEEIKAGESLVLHGKAVLYEKPVGMGHKIAEQFIAAGQKIIKYGVPIGSALTDINIGTHVHLHNMQSDYIPTYTIERGSVENTDRKKD